MAKQTFTTGQVLTAAQMTSLQQTAMGGGSTTAKTASYVLVAADAGTVVQMNSASATTITVNTALFAAGDTVQIQNVGAGVCTVTAGTATVSTSAVLALKQYDAGSLYFNSTSAALFFAADAADNTSPLTTKGDLYGFSTVNARIPIGTNNQILTADSAEALGLKWATPATSASGLTLIARTTFSNVASQAFDSVFTTTYSTYLAVIEQIFAATGDDDLHLQLRYAGPSTQTTTYYGSAFASPFSGVTFNTQSNNASQLTISTQTGSSTTFGSGHIYFNVVGDASAKPNFRGLYTDKDANQYMFGGQNDTARVYTGFLLKSSSTNITGTVAIYGLAEA